MKILTKVIREQSTTSKRNKDKLIQETPIVVKEKKNKETN